eukprot:3775667-Lingulodinium_polyedra.AAC.1
MAVFGCADGEILMNPGSGVPPGFCDATAIFNTAYEKALRAFREDTVHETALLSARPPLTG